MAEPNFINVPYPENWILFYCKCMPPERKKEVREHFLFKEDGTVVCQVKNIEENIIEIESDTDDENFDNELGNEAGRPNAVASNSSRAVSVCGTKFSNNHLNTLRKHLKKKHSKIYDTVVAEEEKRKSVAIIDAAKAEPAKKKLKQSRMASFVDSPMEVYFSLRGIEVALLQMVTIDGRPLTAVEDSGVQALLLPYYNALTAKNIPFVKMTRYHIGKLLAKRAEEFRRQISGLVKNKFVCVKIDSASRKHRSFLGVNIQFFDTKGKFHLVTLGVLEIKERHTSEHIKKLTLDMLAKFGISHRDIYSVTTDNGSNMLRAVKDMNAKILEDNKSCENNNYVGNAASDEHEIDEIIELELEPADSDNNVEPAATIENDNTSFNHELAVTLTTRYNDNSLDNDSVVGTRNDDISFNIDFDPPINNIQDNSMVSPSSSFVITDYEIDESFCAPITSTTNRLVVNDSTVSSDLIPTDDASPGPSVQQNTSPHPPIQQNNERSPDELLVDKIVTIWGSDDDIISVRCAAHTLQLALKDSWVEYEKTHPSILKKVREVVKKMRTTNEILRQLSWKTKLLPIPDCPTRWTSTYNMINRLLVIKKFVQMIAINERELYLDKEEWAQIENLRSCLEPCKTGTIALQKEDITLNEFYKIWLLTIKRTKAIDHAFSKCLVTNLEVRGLNLFSNICLLAALFLDTRYRCFLTTAQEEIVKKHLMNLSARIHEKETVPQVQNEISQASEMNYDDSDDDFSTIVAEAHEKKKGSSSNYDDVAMMIDDYIVTEKAFSSKRDILDFWRLKKERYSKLYKIVMIVYSTPSTQTSVERLFSSLKYIVNDHRQSLLDRTIEDILLLRCNRSWCM